jgi:hypothetical protein
LVPVGVEQYRRAAGVEPRTFPWGKDEIRPMFIADARKARCVLAEMR